MKPPALVPTLRKRNASASLATAVWATICCFFSASQVVTTELCPFRLAANSLSSPSRISARICMKTMVTRTRPNNAINKALNAIRRLRSDFIAFPSFLRCIARAKAGHSSVDWL